MHHIAPVLLKFILLSVLALLIGSCGKKGCTDPNASNYLSVAQRDDGTCEFIGCMDPDAYNYDAHAQEGGTCTYPGQLRVFRQQSVGNGKYVEVYVDDQYVGRLQSPCNPNPTCTTSCNSLLVDDLPPLTHIVSGYLIRQSGQTAFDTISVLAGRGATVPSGSCVAVAL